MKYHSIIFDADETLFDFNKTEQVALAQTMNEFSLPYEESFHLPIYNEVNTRIWKEFELGLITLKELKVERFHRFFASLGIVTNEHLTPQSFADQYMHFLSKGGYLFDGALEVVEKLHFGRKLIILTNGLTKVQTGRIGNSEIAPYLSDTVISEAVGLAKPDPRIFALAFQRNDIAEKGGVLMVGDSLTSDIQGGIRFGIDTCWYNPKKAENQTPFRPTYEIQNLKELFDLVE